MSRFSAALSVETTKLLKSRIFPTLIGIFGFIGVVLALMALVSSHPELAGRSPTLAAKARVLASADWPSYLSLLTQVILSLGPIGFGVATAWVFGREFTDRVLKDLLALPTARWVIVIAKFTMTAVWCLILAALLLACACAAATFLAMPGWNSELFWEGLTKYTLASVLTAVLIGPVAFLACVGRGVLLPIGASILFLVFAQFVGIGIPAATGFFPWTIPALFSGILAGPEIPRAGMVSAAILAFTSLSGLAATILWWELADQK